MIAQYRLHNPLQYDFSGVPPFSGIIRTSVPGHMAHSSQELAVQLRLRICLADPQVEHKRSLA
jgi:hypothetical protein